MQIWCKTLIYPSTPSLIIGILRSGVQYMISSFIGYTMSKQMPGSDFDIWWSLVLVSMSGREKANIWLQCAVASHSPSLSACFFWSLWRARSCLEGLPWCILETTFSGGSTVRSVGQWLGFSPSAPVTWVQVPSLTTSGSPWSLKIHVDGDTWALLLTNIPFLGPWW